jgi:hypothetical protein
MFCRQQVAELRPHVDELRRIGVEPHVIGSGTPPQAQQFVDRMHTGDLPIWSDAPLASYRAAGLKRSVVGTMLTPSSWVKGLKVAFRYRQGLTLGDPWQLGGALLARPDGTATWKYVSQASGDHPELAQMLDEARRAVT